MNIQQQRQTALQILLQLQLQQSYSNLALQQMLPKNAPPSANRFITALVYGVIERQLTLDRIIEQYTNRKLDPEVRVILQMGFYQLLYMDQVSDNIAVNETVTLCHAVKKVSAKGMVNAILRRFLRDGKSLPVSKDPWVQKSITYSTPEWLVKRLYEEYGKERTTAFLQNALKPAPIYIRVNTNKTTATQLAKTLQQHGIIVKETPLPNALQLKQLGNLERLETFQQGHFYVQDLASQLCAILSEVQPHQLVYDVCAAPGSKSFSMALEMQNTGRVVAFDLYEHKISLIRQTANRLGLDNIQATLSDATVFDQNLEKADVVLCDVPCGGFGIIRRKPEIKYKEKSSVAELPQLQLQILKNAARYVKIDGRLIYATCSLSRAENDQVVSAFLQEHPSFELLPPPEPYLQYSENNCLTLFPEYFGSDGFFIAVMQAKGGTI